MLLKALDLIHHRLPHSHQKTGGLFDEGFASDKLGVTGNDPACDLLKAIDNGSDILNLQNFNMFAEMDPFHDASLDSFIDLSEYLMEKSTDNNVTDALPDTVLDTDTVMTSVDVAGTSVATKRNWEEIIECLEPEKPVTFNTSPDHEYSAKKPRLASTSSETESVSPPKSSANKYKVRREKNNVASKRSREIRKNKFSEMEEKAEHYVVENEKMRARIVELEALAKEMKAALVARLSGK